MSTVTTRASSARTGTSGPMSPHAGGNLNALLAATTTTAVPAAAPGGGGGGGNPPGPPGPPGPGGPPGGGGGGAGGPPPQVPNPQAIFALTPSGIVQGFIDYSTREGQRLYETAKAPLEDKFDCKPELLRQFVESFRKRAISADWLPTLQVPVNGFNHDLTEHYGLLTFDQIRAHAISYINTETRNFQNAYQIYECLYATLTQEARTKVSTRFNDYNVGNKPDGLLYFKAIIATAQVDTPATISQIRYKLMNLAQHMQNIGSNIQQFNIDVQTYVLALEARGHSTSDLLVNLFRGYKSASDETFRKYICDREDDYNDGTLLNLTPEKLMSLAVNKYRTLVDDNVWNQQSPQHKQIVALNAQIQKLIGDKNKSPSSTTTNKDAKPNTTGGKGKGNKGNKDRKYPDWKYKAPSGNEPKAKSIKGKQFYWCKHHELWCEHTEDQCRKAQGNTAAKNKPTEGNKETPKLHINRNLAALATDDDF